MFTRNDVIEYYNSDPNVQRLKYLESRIRDVHNSLYTEI